MSTSPISLTFRDKQFFKSVACPVWTCRCLVACSEKGGRRGSASPAAGGAVPEKYPTDYTKPRQTIQSPEIVDKAPKQYTKP